MRCAVFGCKNSNQIKNRIANSCKISFFNFPKEKTLCEKWVILSGRQDSFNTNFARICSEHFDNNCLLVNTSLAQFGIVQRTTLKRNSVPSLNLPYQSKKVADAHEQRLAKRKFQTHSDVSEDKVELGSSPSPLLSSAYQAQPPFFTGHDYIFGIHQTSTVDGQLVYHTQNNTTKMDHQQHPIEYVCIEDDSTSNDLLTQPVNLQRVCRFCLIECNDTVRIPWDEWEHSDLALLYEKIVNVKLQISVRCSELYCGKCSRRLHDTFQSIQLFREADNFWKRHLRATQQHIEPIEEVKIEELDYDVADCTADYLESVADDVVFVEEPLTAVDDITKLECATLEKNKEDDWMYDEDFSYPEPFAPKVLETACNEEVFNCTLCDKVYKTARGLTEHKDAIHETKNAYCKICDKNMSTAYGLRKHLMNQHGPQLILKCRFCSHISKNLPNLKAHEQLHNRSLKTMTPCDDCGKVFLDRRQMMVHKRNIHGPHVACMCTVCGKILRNQTRLNVHMLTHDPIKPMCEQCQKSFSCKKSIIEHMNVVHKQGTPHICEQCGRRFGNRAAGRQHSQKCKGQDLRFDPSKRDERKLTINCILCNHAFAALDTLQRHYMNMHDPKQLEKVCLQCNKMLDTPQAVEDHKQTVHESLQCKICKKNCLSEISLKIHMEGHGDGKKRFECDICGGSYARFEYLKMHHRRRHTTDRPFKCMEPDCGLAFPDNGALLNHNRIRHEPIADRPHACNFCNKRFVTASVLRRHVSQHTGIGVYDCDECDENFKHSYQLRAHVVSVHPRI